MSDALPRHRFHRLGTSAIRLGITILAGAVLLLWCWNTVAAGLFALPTMQWKHAVALELLPLAFALPVRAMLCSLRDASGTPAA